MVERSEVVRKLNELLIAIGGYEDPRRAATEWKQVFRLLGQTGIPARQFQSVVGMRDVAGLAELVEQLAVPGAATAGQDAPSPEECKKALQAFRKRVKFTRLDDESALGRGPLSKGADDRLGAIAPPNEWPETVWQELVRQGKLKYLGDGLYELAR